MSQTALVAVSKAREWLAKAEDVLDVVDLRDQAAAVEYYRKTLGSSGPFFVFTLGA